MGRKPHSSLVPGVLIPTFHQLKLHKATRKVILFPATEFGGAFDGRSWSIIQAITTQLIYAIVYLVTVLWVLVPVVKLVNRSTIHFIRSLLQACHLDAKVRFIVKWLITANKVIY